jgi:uncharacterized protein YbjT (DUF2867 family)
VERATDQRRVFVTGGTGYLGVPLIEALLERGHEVRALARRGSEGRLPTGCDVVPGNALDGATFADQVALADTLVHLVGVSHSAPWKERQFREVDLASVRASVQAARTAGVRHMVYLSVAQPAPLMKTYVAVRAECERQISEAGLSATCVRPWYVLGPGHVWPYALIPVYALFERLPGTSETARRLGLVRRAEMIDALAWAVENPAEGIRVMDVERIRSFRAT